MQEGREYIYTYIVHIQKSILCILLGRMSVYQLDFTLDKDYVLIK